MRRLHCVVLAAAVVTLVVVGGLAWRREPDVPSTLPRVASRAPQMPAAVQSVSGRAPSFAVAAAGSRPASTVQDETARCGFDQMAQFGEPVVDEDGRVVGLPQQTRPAGPGFTGAEQRLDAALRATGDPFDAAVADALNVQDLRSRDERLAALVQDALIGGDPRIDTLAFSACETSDGSTSVCADLDSHQWAARDPGNATPWFYALRRADQANDAAAQREALQHLASASHLSLRFGKSAAEIARLPLASEADLAAQNELALTAISFELFPPFSALTRRCRDKAGGDPWLAATCDRIGSTLFDHSDTVMGRNIGGALHRLATGDASWLERAHAEQKALSDLHVAIEAAEASFETSPCAATRRQLRGMVEQGRLGELAWLRQARREAGEAPSGVTPSAPSRTPARTADPASSRS